MASLFQQKRIAPNLLLRRTCPVFIAEAERSKHMAWFYEICSSNNAVLKREGGFATQDAAKIAGRADAKKMKSSRQPDSPDVETVLVGQNAEKPTR